MGIKSFYNRRYFEKKNSKLSIKLLLIFWVFFALIAGFKFQDIFLKVLLLIFALYQLIGLITIYREGLYLKPGEKRQITKNITPEEFLERVKKEVKHGKK